MPLPIVHFNDPVLRKKGAKVTVFDNGLKRLAADMVETMHAYEGVGLAGPQVHLPLKVFVFEVQERVAKRRGVKQLGAGAIFNATWEPVGTEMITDWEGCLSVPFLGGETPHHLESSTARLIAVNGRDVGQTLIAEGLVRKYGGRKKGWCG